MIDRSWLLDRSRIRHKSPDYYFFILPTLATGRRAVAPAKGASDKVVESLSKNVGISTERSAFKSEPQLVV